jgi:hypothetical protein
MDAYLTIAGAEYIVGYSYKITSPGAPEQGPSYSSGGQPAEPFEFEVEFVDLRKDEGGGKETFCACPEWLQAEIEAWLYEDSDGRIYEAIESEEGEQYAEHMDRRDEQRANRRMGDDE